jgi:hypothetical protein
MNIMNISSESGMTPFAPVGADRSRPGLDDQVLGSVIADLYGLIAVLDSAQQSDFAGRLHALTLELRERLAASEKPPFS